MSGITVYPEPPITVVDSEAASMDNKTTQDFLSGISKSLKTIVRQNNEAYDLEFTNEEE